MIIRMMYILPMLLGRTFDVKENSVGVDIFPLESVSKPRENAESFYRSSFKTVESSSDVKDVLDIHGDLALSIKAGMFTFKGMGSYLKESMNIQNSVDILTKVSFRTVSKSLPHSARPESAWSRIGRQHLGTHFVRSILYGGDLIACIRFKAASSEHLQDIRATIKSSLEAGTALDLVGEGKLELLDKKLEKKASMEINYYATVPLEGVPNDIGGLRELVRNFEKHVAKVNNGLGVPVEVELEELSSLNQNFAYIKNTDLETELTFFEEYFDDLMTTKSRLKSWIETLPDTLPQEQETLISKFSERLSTVLRKFIETVANLDLEKSSDQLEAAKAAYKEGKGLGMAGKFHRELNKLMKKVVIPNELPENRGSSIYVHHGSSECVKDQYTSTVFSGYLSSSPRNISRAGYNYVCLPKEPDVDNSEETLDESTSLISGVKYGLLLTSPFKINEDDTVLRGISCVVCLVKQRPSVFTFIGLSDCPNDSGWTLQYSGYMMTSTDVEGSENVCVDSKHESHQDSDVGYNDQSVNFVLVETKETTFLPCVVCTK